MAFIITYDVQYEFEAVNGRKVWGSLGVVYETHAEARVAYARQRGRHPNVSFRIKRNKRKRE